MVRRKALGQYFTPLEVVAFCLETLQRLDAETTAATRRLLDPACGEGAFLAGALERGICLTRNTYGVDLDGGLETTWREQGLSGPEGPWLGVGDGLLADSVCGQALEEGGFDWMVGNPPYAGEGLRTLSVEALEQVRGRYELAARRPGDSLRRLPVEVLFVERFWRLCRPGGWVAMVLPEGLAANARWRFVREWLLPRVTLQAVVELPRKTFRAGGGITALTCVVIYRKAPAPQGHEVTLARVERLEELEGLVEIAGG